MGAVGVWLHVPHMLGADLRICVLHPDHSQDTGLLNRSRLPSVCPTIPLQHDLDIRGSLVRRQVAPQNAVDGAQCSYHFDWSALDRISPQQWG